MSVVGRLAAGVIAGALAVVVVTAFLEATSDGLDLYQGDSVEYGATARSIIEGRGFTVPYGRPGMRIDFATPTSTLRLYGPGYPTVLALLRPPRVDPFDWSRYLQAALLIVNAVLVGLLVRRRGGWSEGVAITIGSIVLLTGIKFHAAVASEPLFISLELVALATATKWLGTGRRAWLYSAAFTAGAGFAVRYVGAALVLVVLLAAFLAPSGAGPGRLRRTAARKVRDMMIVGLLGILPVVGWLVYSLSATGSVAARTIAFHPLTLVDVKIFASSASLWFLPSSVPIWFRTVGLLGAVSLIIMVLSRVGPSSGGGILAWIRSDALVLLAVAFVTVYVGGMALSMSFLDAQMTPSTRILYPIFVAALVAGGSAIGGLVGASRAVAGIVMGVMLVTAGLHAVASLDALSSRGGGFYSSGWQPPPLVEVVAQASSATPVFSNAPDAIYFLLGRSTWSIPTRYDPWSLARNALLDRELDELVNLVESRSGLVAVFDPVDRGYLVDIPTLEGAGLVVVRRFPEGVLLGAPTP